MNIRLIEPYGIYWTGFEGDFDDNIAKTLLEEGKAELLDQKAESLDQKDTAIDQKAESLDQKTESKK